jgi:hypothetical protein
VATRAVPLGGILEQLRAAIFLVGEFQFVAEKGVVAAGVGKEFSRDALERIEGLESGTERMIDVIENVGAELRAKRVRVSAVAQFRHHLGGSCVRHFIGGEQRQLGLVADGGRPPVPGESTDRAIVAVGEMVPERKRRRRPQVAQRRHGAGAALIQATTPHGNCPPRRRPVRVAGVVTGRAGKMSRRGQGGIEKYQASQHGEGGLGGWVSHGRSLSRARQRQHEAGDPRESPERQGIPPGRLQRMLSHQPGKATGPL